MPELPEVQTTVDGINARIRGAKILGVWTDYKSLFHRGKDNINDPVFFARFKKAVIGGTVVGAERRGKNILINVDSGVTIIIHMKMTGHIMHGAYKKLPKKDAQGEWWRPADPNDAALNDPFNRFIHFVLSLSDGKQLVLSDMRKFAKVTMAKTAEIHQSKHLLSHGPEPFDPKFGPDELRAAAMRRPKGAVKQVLMNHEVVSGIGNIYSDEILWKVGIHPLTRVGHIPEKMWPQIHRVMRETLSRGIDFGGDSMSDYRNIDGKPGKFQGQHNAYRKTGKPCGKRGCHGTIRRLKVGGRSAHFCDSHQKLL
jgi:formamidopyrimidine-DNA glycosylase